MQLYEVVMLNPKLIAIVARRIGMILAFIALALLAQAGALVIDHWLWLAFPWSAP